MRVIQRECRAFEQRVELFGRARTGDRGPRFPAGALSQASAMAGQAGARLGGNLVHHGKDGQSLLEEAVHARALADCAKSASLRYLPVRKPAASPK